MRKERLTYRDLVRRILAGSLLQGEERRVAQDLLTRPDSPDTARLLGELLDDVAHRGALMRLDPRPTDGPNVRRYLDPYTEDHWVMELPGPAVAEEPVARPAPSSAPRAPAAPVAAEPEPAPVPAPSPEPEPVPRVVEPISVVDVEPGVPRRFVDNRTGEPLRTLFGTFSPCATPEEIGNALTPLAGEVVRLTGATSVRFHVDCEDDATLLPVPLLDQEPAPHDPLGGRVATDVLGRRRSLHVPDLTAAGVHAADGARGALFCAPLVSGEAVAGLMEVRRSRPGPFDEDELRLFSVVALSAGGALARAEILEKLIFLDRLTGLYNRAYFDDQIEREIERANRNGTSVALLMCDLDHFKRVNDSHGHQVGDQALVHLASIIRSNIRQIDLAARYGGEEFAILLPSITRARAARTAERLRRVVADARFGDVIPQLGEQRLSISLGFALYPDDAATAKQLIDRADRVALYAAKNRGRNRVVPWSAARETRSGVGS